MKDASPSTWFSRVALQVAFLDVQNSSQVCPMIPMPQAVSALRPETWQSARDVEPAAAVVFSGDGQGRHGSLPVELYEPMMQSAARVGHGVTASQVRSTAAAFMAAGVMQAAAAEQNSCRCDVPDRHGASPPESGPAANHGPSGTGFCSVPS